MYLINLHAVPTSESDHFNSFLGAYVSAYIDFRDVDGAIQLALFYVEQEGWVVNNVEEDYFLVEDENELSEDKKELHDEAKEYGYALLFNAYESADEEE